MKFRKILLFSIIIIISILLVSGCSKTSETDSNIEGEWTYTNGLAEIEFDDNGKAAVITPSGDTTKVTQYNYKIDDDQLTLLDRDSDEVVMVALMEVSEKNGKKYLTLSDLHDKDGVVINPNTATFERLSDSTSAID